MRSLVVTVSFSCTVKPNTHRRRDSTVGETVCTEFATTVGVSLDESEQMCQQRSRVASCRRRERTRRRHNLVYNFPVLFSY